MKGHIYILTKSGQSHPAIILSQKDEPKPDDYQGAEQLRYVAFFKNAHIAYMHVHNTLKRQLEDINTRTYRADLTEAIAAVEAEDLKHERIWIDPALSEAELNQLDNYKAGFQAKRQRFNRNYLIVGGIGLLLLFFLLLGGVLHV